MPQSLYVNLVGNDAHVCRHYVLILFLSIILQNLLKTVETTKSDARDASRNVQVEARLRADLSHLRSERNDALAEAAEFKRKAELLEEELRTTKAKFAKVVQEKIKMERDSRAAISLARSLDTHASSDCDFYKRKVTSRCYET